MALRILLAENNIAAQKTGVKILSSAGHYVSAVSNGLAVIKTILDGESYPDVLMLDVHLPGLTGIEICEKVKSIADTANIAVLLTDSRIETLHAIEGIKTKADGFITKPFDAGMLVTAIERLADRKHLDNTPRFDASRLNESTYVDPQVAKEVEQAHSAAQSSLQPAGEVCDVCGFVNLEPTFACQRCDIPLPSSVKSSHSC